MVEKRSVFSRIPDPAKVGEYQSPYNETSLMQRTPIPHGIERFRRSDGSIDPGGRPYADWEERVFPVGDNGTETRYFGWNLARMGLVVNGSHPDVNRIVIKIDGQEKEIDVKPEVVTSPNFDPEDKPSIMLITLFVPKERIPVEPCFVGVPDERKAAR